jgi:hypothetical protein
MKILGKKPIVQPKLNVDCTFTTASRDYFLKNGKQLAESFKVNSGEKLVVYSEDDLSEFRDLISYRPLRNFEVIEQFQKVFRNNYGSKLSYMHYSIRMDIWAIKIFAQLQFLEENPSTFSLFLDSDTYIRNSGFNKLVNEFVLPARNFDCGLFRREDTFLHPETGFITFRNSENLLNSYRSMLQMILSGEYKNLPSWTDDSLIDYEIQNDKITALDFCKEYNLISSHPMYESKLRESFIHLKGLRKGRFSRLKLLRGKYA